MALTKKEILDLMAQGETQQVIDALLEATDSLNRGIYREVVIQSAKYKQYKKDGWSGVHTAENLEIRLSRINQALIEIVQKIPEEIDEKKIVTKPGTRTTKQKHPYNRLLRLGFIAIIVVLTLGYYGWHTFQNFNLQGGGNTPELIDRDTLESIEGPTSEKKDTANQKREEKHNGADQTTKTPEEKPIIPPPKAVVAVFTEGENNRMGSHVKQYLSEIAQRKYRLSIQEGQYDSETYQKIFHQKAGIEPKTDGDADYLIICSHHLEQKKEKSEHYGEITVHRQTLSVKIFDLKTKRFIPPPPDLTFQTISFASDTEDVKEKEKREELKKRIDQLELTLKH